MDHLSLLAYSPFLLIYFLSALISIVEVGKRLVVTFNLLCFTVFLVCLKAFNVATVRVKIIQKVCTAICAVHVCLLM